VEFADVDRIMNAVPEGWQMIAVAVPTRALRVIVEDDHKKFRVEQLDARTWTWGAISTHLGDDPWESLGPAIQDMCTKQVRLKEKLKLAQHEARMANIKAQETH
jgi:hypothetical protein